ncbi:response regulator [Trinickia terrae]|uniref:Response regulator n=1 Tax=Trinickia terrae TaxID=2571161 RepID=A0A4U1HJU8_9BURK|nr:HD domain-containing phosphohydrolase [Trinickia terrae]TKC81422.1 response regulator [Trinickia terrae]
MNNPGERNIAADAVDSGNTAAPEQSAAILIVDDEPGVLSALKRLLHRTSYRVFTAESGAAGLDILAQQPIDVVISDMRMPHMSGAEFLTKVHADYPQTARIILTGYSDIDSVVSAINEGGVHHYLQKPWHDQELLLTLRRALEQQELRRETARLLELTRVQNEQLKAFNTTLEAEVLARTGEIKQTVLFLERAEFDLKSSFTAMLKVCANMIEMRCGALGGQSARVAELAKQLALDAGMSEFEAQELFFAGLLLGIGKLALPDALLQKSIDQFTPAEAQLYYQHPLHAEMTLMPVANLQHAGGLIRLQYERYDGRGTPDGLNGEAIPLGARVLAIVRDFEDLHSGALLGRHLIDTQILKILQSQAGIRYDPVLVSLFIKRLSAAQPSIEHICIDTAKLKTGMKLADDLRTPRGMLLLTRDSVLEAHHIAQIRRFEQSEGTRFSVTVVEDRA